MPRIGKTEDWKGLKLGFLKTDWGRVIGKIKRNELDCRDTAPLIYKSFLYYTNEFDSVRSI